MPSKLREDLPDPEKLLIAPLVTVISPTTKFVVGSLLVKVRESVASLDVNPSEPSAAVMVIVGPVIFEIAPDPLGVTHTSAVL